MEKICVYLYRNKNKNSINILYFLPKKNNARISIGETIRKRPQKISPRRVVRRKEKRKERKSLLAVMVRRFFYLWRKSCEKRLARRIYRNKTCICLYRNKNRSKYIYIIVTPENLYMFIPKQKPE